MITLFIILFWLSAVTALGAVALFVVHATTTWNPPIQRKIRVALPHDPQNTYRLEHEIYEEIYGQEYVLAMHHGKTDCSFCNEVHAKTAVARIKPSLLRPLDRRKAELIEKQFHEKQKAERLARKAILSANEARHNTTLGSLEVLRPADVPAGADVEVIRGDGMILTVLWRWYDVKTGRQFQHAQPISDYTRVTMNMGFG